jgi:hypothetical protein
VKCSASSCATTGARLLANPLRGVATFNLPFLIVALMLAMTGCVTPVRVLERTPPAVQSEIQIPGDTWWQVESDIGAASLAVTGLTKNYARGSMESWRGRVSQRTETDFVPWFTDYWTQQWLAVKLAWYNLNAGEKTDLAVKRLAKYLQEQYDDRVLIPVAKEIDPNVVREQATQLYVQFLGEQLQGIPQRYGIPQAQFDQRLKEMPAISLAPPAPSASLYQIIHADPLARLPAFAALTAQIRKDGSGGAGSGPMDSRISPVANRVGEKLAEKVVRSGGASAAAAVVGGFGGMMISLGAAGFGAMAHENDRPQIEAQLRESLNGALDDMWFSLMEDRATGVMAGVYRISDRIEESLLKTVTHPVGLEPVPREMPLSGR